LTRGKPRAADETSRARCAGEPPHRVTPPKARNVVDPDGIDAEYRPERGEVGFQRVRARQALPAPVRDGRRRQGLAVDLPVGFWQHGDVDEAPGNM
jgi:hypothetical protein